MTDISPMRKGATWPDAVWQFYDKLGNLVILPSGTTFVLYIENPTANNSTVQGQGTWDTTNIGSGSVTYHWNAQDTANTGNFNIYAKFTTPGGQIGSSDNIPWTVEQ